MKRTIFQPKVFVNPPTFAAPASQLPCTFFKGAAIFSLGKGQFRSTQWHTNYLHEYCLPHRLVQLIFRCPWIQYTSVNAWIIPPPGQKCVCVCVYLFILVAGGGGGLHMWWCFEGENLVRHQDRKQTALRDLASEADWPASVLARGQHSQGEEDTRYMMRNMLGWITLSWLDRGRERGIPCFDSMCVFGWRIILEDSCWLDNLLHEDVMFSD